MIGKTTANSQTLTTRFRTLLMTLCRLGGSRQKSGSSRTASISRELATSDVVLRAALNPDPSPFDSMVHVSFKGEILTSWSLFETCTTLKLFKHLMHFNWTLLNFLSNFMGEVLIQRSEP